MGDFIFGKETTVRELMKVLSRFNDDDKVVLELQTMFGGEWSETALIVKSGKEETEIMKTHKG
jgi:pantothenate kinase